jgi:hypothetical protein
MFGHHLQFHLVPTAHPAAPRERVPIERGDAERIFRRATAEAALLRARLCEHEGHGGCDGAVAAEAA